MYENDGDVYRVVSKQTPTTPIRVETADFGPIEGVLGGHPYFPRSVYRLELCVKWLRNRQFKFHYSVFFSLHDMRKRGKTRRKKAGIERNSHFSPSSPFLSPPLSTPAA